MIEIERKFLPRELPSEHLPDAGEHMRQGYLAIDGNVVVRIRITERTATLTVKGGDGMARTEVESTVTADDAEALWALTEGRRIDKIRYRVPLDDPLVAEIDVYAGDLEGLCTVEVEFDSEAAATDFEPPGWFGRDVTGERGWSNAALARDGRPDR